MTTDVSPNPEDCSPSSLSILSLPPLQEACKIRARESHITITQVSDYLLFQHLFDSYIMLHSIHGMGPEFPDDDYYKEIIRPCLEQDLLRLSIPAAMTCWLTTNHFRWEQYYPTMNDIKSKPDDNELSIRVNAPGTDFSYGILAFDANTYPAIKKGLFFSGIRIEDSPLGFNMGRYIELQHAHYPTEPCQNWAKDKFKRIRPGADPESILESIRNT